MLPIVRKTYCGPEHPLLTPENVTEYYVNSFEFVLTKWLIQENEISVEQLLEAHDLIISNSLESLLNLSSDN